MISLLFRLQGISSASDSDRRNRQPTPVFIQFDIFPFFIFYSQEKRAARLSAFPIFRSICCLQVIHMEFFVSSCDLTTFFTFSVYHSIVIKKYYCTARDPILLTCPEPAFLPPRVVCRRTGRPETPAFSAVHIDIFPLFYFFKKAGRTCPAFLIMLRFIAVSFSAYDKKRFRIL